MADFTLEKAKSIIAKHITEPHLIVHSTAVSAAMGAMATHFGEDKELWEAIGYLHDVDYEKWPEEHLQHTEEILKAEGISDDIIHAVLSHGYALVNDVKPETNLEKSLYTVDELTGIVHAAARMRPNGITDLEIGSFMKKFKDKKFAAKCDRDVIQTGCDMLSMEVKDVSELCIAGMKEYATELGILPKE